MTESKKSAWFNVGGKDFLLDYDTVMKSTRLHGKYVVAHQDDIDNKDVRDQSKSASVFLDRNGELFQDILEYWRSQTILTDSPDHLEKLENEANYFGVKELVTMINDLLKADDGNADGFDYRVIQHPFNCNYLIRLSDGDSKPFEEDSTIVSGYKYCLSQNVYESKLVIQRPRKRAKLDHN